MVDSRRKIQAARHELDRGLPLPVQLLRPAAHLQLLPSRERPTTSTSPSSATRSIDAEIARARSLQTSDPQAAAQLWSKVDRDIVDQAPWVVHGNPRATDFVSRRVGNYQYNPQWGALLDQMWVR